MDMERWRKEQGIKNYEKDDFLKSVFKTGEDYLNNKPCCDIECSDCGKNTKFNRNYYNGVSYKSIAGKLLIDKMGSATCWECNVQHRLRNY